MDIPKDNSELLSNLEYLIAQTYEVENEFKELKNILDGVIELLPQAIWVLDEAGEIIIQNAKSKPLEAILETNEEEISIQERVFLIQKSNLEDKTIISATDITEQKRNEKLISMGQMAAHLAHEIRNPIGSISILLSTLSKKCHADDILLEMKRAIFRVERIIKSTLLFSKGMQAKKKPVNLKHVQKELQNIIHYYSYSKEIEFIYFLPDLEILADFDLLMLALQNIIFNAIDAIEEDERENGLIEVIYDQDNTDVYFNIYDSGEPFPDKNILFEAFKSTKTKGNGLGLALSMQILHAHGGDIKLSEAKKGFQLTLPKR